ncbi:MAG: DNA (cytosine-5-)-methyltransferase [Gammaproteobacteria bacterium]|nr:DNA (cytosine-5-)-methyltransferase [Gammaproteobacteria bacterium]
MRVVGLFAGIGGFESGLAAAGHSTILLCDNDPHALAVLAHRFPGVRRHGDVVDLEDLPPGTEVVAAGFPCQNLSMAGDKTGLDGAKSGVVDHLFRLLGRDPAPWVVIENVYFMLHLGRGAAMEGILGPLERLGYRWAYRVVDTRAFGLAQRRRRVFIVATRTAADPRGVLLADNASSRPHEVPDIGRPIAFYWTEGRSGSGLMADATPPLKAGSSLGIPCPPAVLLPNGRVVTPPIEVAERLQGFAAGWSSALRGREARYRWRLVGNAVSVPVAKWIGDRLNSAGEYDASGDLPWKPNDPWPGAAWNAGSGRFVAERTEFPLRRPRGRLSAYKTEAWPDLSVRALRGFVTRARKGNLRYPPGFLERLERAMKRTDLVFRAD